MNDLVESIDFTKHAGLIPAVVQDINTRDVLTIGFMNKEAVSETIKSGVVTFYSQPKAQLVVKADTLGAALKFKEMLLDCDHDSLLILALAQGPTCQAGTYSCYGEQARSALGFVSRLEEIVRYRKANLQEESYTTSLFKKGLKKISQKVGEEGVEVSIEGVTGDLSRLKEETADLIYHLLILLAAHNIPFSEICEILRIRNETSATTVINRTP